MQTRLAAASLMVFLGLVPGLAGDQGRSGGGGGSTGILQTQFVDTANFMASNVVFTDGDPGVTIRFGQGDYKLTLRSESFPVTVEIEDPGSVCPDLIASNLGVLTTNLRFLRVDDIAGLGMGDDQQPLGHPQPALGDFFQLAGGRRVA